MYLYTDPSKVVAGVWIGQEPSPEKAHTVAFYSRKSATRQLHYPVHELELLTIVYAVQSFPLHALWYQVHCSNRQQSTFIFPLTEKSPLPPDKMENVPPIIRFQHHTQTRKA